MFLKHFGLYDTVAKTIRSDFISDNDEVAVRSLKETCKLPGTDRQVLRDCVLKYLYSVDSETGMVVDVASRDIVACASIVDEVPEISAADDKTINSIKDNYHKCIQILKTMQDNLKTFETILNNLESRIGSNEKLTNDIIGGKIKCQKYKKVRTAK